MTVVIGLEGVPTLRSRLPHDRVLIEKFDKGLVINASLGISIGMILLKGGIETFAQNFPEAPDDATGTMLALVAMN